MNKSEKKLKQIKPLVTVRVGETLVWCKGDYDNEERCTVIAVKNDTEFRVAWWRQISVSWSWYSLHCDLKENDHNANLSKESSK